MVTLVCFRFDIGKFKLVIVSVMVCASCLWYAASILMVVCLRLNSLKGIFVCTVRGVVSPRARVV